MRYPIFVRRFLGLKLIALLLFASLNAGCDVLQSVKLVAPASFGLRKLTPNIYIEAGADEATQTEIRHAMEKAENALRSAYGSVTSHPIVHACISQGCYERFGGSSSIVLSIQQRDMNCGLG